MSERASKDSVLHNRRVLLDDPSGRILIPGAPGHTIPIENGERGMAESSGFGFTVYVQWDNGLAGNCDRSSLLLLEDDE